MQTATIRRSRLRGPALALLLTLAPWPARADETPLAQAPASCQPEARARALVYLRRLSLDLRGRAPSYDELARVAQQGEVPADMIDAMLSSDDARHQVRAYHRALLWTNVSNVRIANGLWLLEGDGASKPYWIRTPTRATVYRGALVSCLNEPATFNADGTIATKADAKLAGVKREGWVEVHPYWAPKTKVKVCAFDAQENLKGAPAKTGQAARDCATAANHVQCGCGPALRWCQTIKPVAGLGRSTSQIILNAMSDQLLRLAEAVYVGDRPYSELLTTKTIEVNGPISHYLRYQGPTSAGLLFARSDQDQETVTLPFEQVDTWVSAARGPLHAGVLTMPGYLLRFQSNRARANRFYNAFLCKSFEAPAGSIPSGADSCHGEPNLMKRCGCKYCHIKLEPMASHWGRWSEGGLAVLSAESYPQELAACKGPDAAKNATCKRFYLTGAGHPDEEPYIGQLRPYVFATEQMASAIETGPKQLAAELITSGELAACTTRKVWSWLLGEAPQDDQAKLLAKLSQSFVAKGLSFRELVREIVTSDEYRDGAWINGVRQ